MCATFLLSSGDAEEIRNICDELTKKYGRERAERTFDKDLYPKGEAPVIGGNGRAALLKWGFPLKGSGTAFNARAESLEEKKMYSTVLRNRCLIPATAFYEWDKEKRKHRIAVADAKVFYMAGLWRAELLPDGAREFCFTIITTEPNDQIREIHGRMPAIIAPEEREKWLGGMGHISEMLRTFDGKMTIEE